MPTTIFTPATSCPLLLAAALMLFGGSVQAQDSAPAQQNQKSCQASTTAANGNAKDANLDGTYSACSLANGFIGNSTRVSDGTNTTPEFNGSISDQELRGTQSGNANHRLATPQAPANDGTADAPKAPTSNERNYRFATRDFVASEANHPFDDGAGSRSQGRVYNQTGDETYAPLMVSSSLGDGLPTGGSGVGGGGASGGMNTGGSLITTTPEIPPVPEAQTYAMLLAGLGLLALVRRRKSK